MCERCDIYGKIWGERYSHVESTFECESCKYKGLIKSRIFLNFLLLIIYLIFSIYSQLIDIYKFLVSYYMKICKIGVINKGLYINDISPISVEISNFL